ncbi:MAG: carboxypeptidase regulatory-like domain-containing protein [Chloroflexi bacterium]|nr:carboxypeptidase regulatory-like domain-containing protein [Chloroflexota bacterium]
MANKDLSRQGNIDVSDNSSVNARDMIGGDVNIGKDQINVSGNMSQAQGDVFSGDKIIYNALPVPDRSRKSSNSKWFIILAAVVTAVATIIAAFITQCGTSQPPVAFPPLGSLTSLSQNSAYIEITGHVTAYDSGADIPNAKVSLDYLGALPLITYSDHNGFFFFQVTEPQERQSAGLRVEMAGYEPYEQYLTLPPLDKRPLNLRLRALAKNVATLTPPTATDYPSPTWTLTLTATVYPTSTTLLLTPLPAPPDNASIIHDAAFRERSVIINPSFYLFRYAQQLGLGAPQSNEFYFSVENTLYVAQVYKNGIVLAPKDRLAETRQSTLYDPSDPIRIALDASLKDQYLLNTDFSSRLVETAEQSNLGFAVTREFSLPLGSETYFIQRFEKGILYYTSSNTTIYVILI